MKTHLLRIMFVYILSVFTPVDASVIYSYTGNNYDTIDNSGTGASSYAFDTSMNLSGTFVLDAPLDPLLSNTFVNPLSFTFNDGVTTFTEINTTSSAFIFSTDASGKISQWNIFTTINFPNPISVGDLSMSLTTASLGAGFIVDNGFVAVCMALFDGGCSTDTQEGSSTISAGTWVEPTVVPIPPTVWLFGSGIISLIGLARHKARA